MRDNEMGIAGSSTAMTPVKESYSLGPLPCMTDGQSLIVYVFADGKPCGIEQSLRIVKPRCGGGNTVKYACHMLRHSTNFLDVYTHCRARQLRDQGQSSSFHGFSSFCI